MLQLVLVQWFEMKLNELLVYKLFWREVIPGEFIHRLLEAIRRSVMAFDAWQQLIATILLKDEFVF